MQAFPFLCFFSLSPLDLLTERTSINRYGSTIFGGLLADCVLGRKRTLLYVAIAYAAMTCLGESR